MIESVTKRIRRITTSPPAFDVLHIMITPDEKSMSSIAAEDVLRIFPHDVLYGDYEVTYSLAPYGPLYVICLPDSLMPVVAITDINTGGWLNVCFIPLEWIGHSVKRTVREVTK